MVGGFEGFRSGKK